MANLFDALPATHDEETFTSLLERPGVRIERIVSTGQSTPPGEWMEQPWDEWVLLLSGGAGLLIEGGAERSLRPGDHLLVPARTRHRVTRTDADPATVWLAIHFG